MYPDRVRAFLLHLRAPYAILSFSHTTHRCVVWELHGIYIKLLQVTQLTAGPKSQPPNGPSLSFQRKKELCSRPYLAILG